MRLLLINHLPYYLNMTPKDMKGSGCRRLGRFPNNLDAFRHIGPVMTSPAKPHVKEQQVWRSNVETARERCGSEAQTSTR